MLGNASTTWLTGEYISDRLFHPQCLRMIALVRQRDSRRACEFAAECVRRLGAERSYLDIFIPAVFVVGELFTSGEIDAKTCEACVAEVFALMEQARGALVRRPGHGRRCFASFMPGYGHSVGFVAICHWLERDGWEVIRPEPVPAEPELVGRIVASDADVVALSCSLPRQVVQARRVIREVRKRGCRASIWIGGVPINVVPGMFERTGADRTAKDIVSFTRDLAKAFGYETATPADLGMPG